MAGLTQLSPEHRRPPATSHVHPQCGVAAVGQHPGVATTNDGSSSEVGNIVPVPEPAAGPGLCAGLGGDGNTCAELCGVSGDCPDTRPICSSGSILIPSKKDAPPAEAADLGPELVVQRFVDNCRREDLPSRLVKNERIAIEHRAESLVNAKNVHLRGTRPGFNLNSGTRE